jgi:hypothetical protein
MLLEYFLHLSPLIWYIYIYIYINTKRKVGFYITHPRRALFRDIGLLYSSYKSVLFCFFFVFKQCFFKKNYSLILNLFFIELSHYYDTDRGFDRLTRLTQFIFFFLIIFFLISSFNILLIENYTLWFVWFIF